MKTNSWIQKQKKILKKPTLFAINVGPQDTEYLYYRLNVEGVTQKGSFLPTHIR